MDLTGHTQHAVLKVLDLPLPNITRNQTASERVVGRCYTELSGRPGDHAVGICFKFPTTAFWIACRHRATSKSL
jgi:hypothetical protein